MKKVGVMMNSKLKELFLSVCPNIDVEKVNDETRLYEDLGIDSLSMLMLVLGLEENFGLKVDTNMKFKTIGDVLNYVNANAKV